jgi:YidC/Oxa1 family membrane protein insertase
MADQKNTLLAIVLSVIVLVGWQYFFASPQLEKQKQIQQQQQAQQQTKTGPQGPQTPSAAPTGPQSPSVPQAPNTQAQAPNVPGTVQRPTAMTRDQVLAASGTRVQIETPRIRGSIALKGARIDDVSLNDYRETVDPKSPNIVLLAPSGSPVPFYAEFGWAAGDQKYKMPDADTVWARDAGNTGALTPANPLRLVWNNGQGMTFRRTITIDANYMFRIADEVENGTQDTLQLYPYGIVSRHGTPQVLGYYILHEGLIGVTGDGKLQEIQYSSIADKPAQNIKTTGGWLGITDKYWAAALVPPQNSALNMRYSSGALGPVKTYQTDYLLDGISIAPGTKAQTQAQLFAGAKETAVIDAYERNDKIKSFELMIDWGWFHFITKPLFKLLDYFFRLTGNFGYAILIVTVLIKIAFFWFANKSYARWQR